MSIARADAKTTFGQPSSFLPSRHRSTELCTNTSTKQSIASTCLSIRGGSDYDSDFDDDSDFSDFDDDLFGLDDTGDLEDDFSEQNTLSLAFEAFQKSPPVTKLFLASSFFCSLTGYLQNRNDFPSYWLTPPFVPNQILPALSS
jgi:hypothetical protein